MENVGDSAEELNDVSDTNHSQISETDEITQFLYLQSQFPLKSTGSMRISWQSSSKPNDGRTERVFPTKRRTRRPNSKPIVIGNNQYGRKGTRRCLRCRVLKQKCEFDHVGLPCANCSKKGFLCGSEHKIMPTKSNSSNEISDLPIENNINMIPPIPATPSDQLLSPFDAQYMQFYWCKSGMWFDLMNDSMTEPKHPLAVCAAHRFGTHVSSKTVRSAILFYSSFRKEGGKESSIGLEYRGQFYESAQEAIDKKSYIELVYACYAMCLCEMSAERRCSEEFGKHANGFLISYRKLVETGETLSDEEHKFLGNAHFLLSQAIKITTSQWHMDDSWFAFAQICLQRLETAAFRLLNSSKPLNKPDDISTWIPKSHWLFEAEECVQRLCSLFDSLAYDTFVLGALIQFYLNKLFRLINTPPSLESGTHSNVYVLKDGKSTVTGDKFTRQLLCLYYVFELQSQILVQQLAEVGVNEVIQTSLAICRLYPPPHESTYPGSEIRFIVNRGTFFAGVAAVEGRNIGVNANIKAKLMYAFTVPRGKWSLRE